MLATIISNLCWGNIPPLETTVHGIFMYDAGEMRTQGLTQNDYLNPHLQPNPNRWRSRSSSGSRNPDASHHLLRTRFDSPGHVEGVSLLTSDIPFDVPSTSDIPHHQGQRRTPSLTTTLRRPPKPAAPAGARAADCPPTHAAARPTPASPRPSEAPGRCLPGAHPLPSGPAPSPAPDPSGGGSPPVVSPMTSSTTIRSFELGHLKCV